MIRYVKQQTCSQNVTSTTVTSPFPQAFFLNYILILRTPGRVTMCFKSRAHAR